MKETLLKTTKKIMLKPKETLVDKVVSEFDEIIEEMKVLDEINVEGVEPMTSPIEVAQTFLRPDEVNNSFSKEQLFKNAPKHDEKYVMIKKVVK